MKHDATRLSDFTKHLVTVLAVSALSGAMAPVAFAQPDFATFEGTVTDEEGNPLEGATLHVRLVSRNQGDELVTDEDGEFRHRGFRPGEYEVTVEKEAYQGFREMLRLAGRATTKREYQLKSLITPAHAAFNRGVEAFNAGNLEEAAAAFEESVELAPEVMDGHANLAAVYARLGRDEDAVAVLERMVELSGGTFQSSAQLAATYAQLNRYDEAISTYETAFAKLEDTADPSLHDHWLNLGTLYFMNDRTTDAMGAFQKALAADPSSAKALLSLGKAHFNLGETEEALASFRKVVELAPGTAEATEAQGYIDEYAKQPPGS